MNVTIRRRLAARLEAGQSGSAAQLLSRLWERQAAPSRPFTLPAHAKVIGIGGATLGGSGKTPLLLTLAQALAAAGVATAVVARSYPRRSPVRQVQITDDFSRVGDEALWLARSLAASRVPVFVGSDRTAALRAAANLAELVLLDGVLQATPRRLDLSVLVLDGVAPWGAGRCPPAGDLRAPPTRLLQATDVVVAGDGMARAELEELCVREARALCFWKHELVGAEAPEAGFMPCATLRGLRLGLLLGVARPLRILQSLRDAHVYPAELRLFGDHQPFDRRGLGLAGAGALDAWLTTDKCMIKLGNIWQSRPVWRLRMRSLLPPALLAAALRVASSSSLHAVTHLPPERA